MINTVFYLIIATLFLNFSIGSIEYFGVNRTFMLMYKGVLENSLVSIGSDGEQIEPYFDQNKLVELSEQYFQNNLPRYVNHYTTSYLFYNYDENSYCVGKYCYSVKISLKAEINMIFHYEKARVFNIKGN